MKLQASEIIDPQIGGHYAFFPLVEQIAKHAHCHDFYEIFLISNGHVFHHVNGESTHLTDGSLVFIRPEDEHYYRKHADDNCELFNLAFLPDTFDALKDYLGLGARVNWLDSPMPPTVQLSPSQKNHLIAQCRQWAHFVHNDCDYARRALRALLAQIAVLFLPMPSEERMEKVPAWLLDLCRAMQREEHIIEGRTALLRLAGRTPEYVGREFRKHLDITPSGFVNNLRLMYARDLLIHTHRDVIDICYDVGFRNLSYFYRLFRDRWQCSPGEYRALNRRSLMP